MIGAGRSKEVEGHIGEGELGVEGKWVLWYLARGALIIGNVEGGVIGVHE